MRNLLSFLIRYNSWLLFAALEAVSLILLFTYNPFQESVYLSSANQISGKFYAGVNHFFGYFNLRSINEDLLEQNGALQERVVLLTDFIQANYPDTITKQIEANWSLANRYDFIIARTISNSVTRTNNYITLNKGRKDGIKPEMGVIDQNGVVGVVNKVSENFTTVMPILNPKFRFSAKLKKNDYFGSLVWDGNDPRFAVLEDLPRHANFQQNDTIVTSGYSMAFPEGIMVGIVDTPADQATSFSSIRVRLSVDFSRLGNVLVISDKFQKEKDDLEKQTLEE